MLRGVLDPNFVVRAELRSVWTDECVRPYANLLLEQRDLPCIRLTLFAAAAGCSYYG